MYVIEEYYPVYKGVKYRWRITRARMVTNNKWSCGNVNRTIAGRRIARTKENRTIRKAIVEGIVLFRDISIIARDDANSCMEDNQETGKYWMT